MEVWVWDKKEGGQKTGSGNRRNMADNKIKYGLATQI